MKPSIQKLYNIFKIEAENNYFNRAVIGGLERILDTWVNEAHQDQMDEKTIQFVVDNLTNYAKLSPEARANTLKAIWEQIQSTGDLANLNPFSTISERKERPPKHNPPSTNEPPKKGEDETTFAHPVRVPEKPRESSEPQLEPSALQAPVKVLYGVGQRYTKILSKLGIFTLEDLLYYLPRRYDDYSKLSPINRIRYGEEVTVIGTIQSITTRKSNNNRPIVEAILSDSTAAVRITIFNQPWQVNKLRVGAQYAIAGKVDQYLGRMVFVNPEIEQLDEELLNSARIVPVYRLTENISQHWLRKTIKQVVDYYAPKLVDYLPEEIRQQATVIDLTHAISQAHFPDSQEDLNQARFRLAFDEILFLQLAVLRQKYHWQQRKAHRFFCSKDWLTNVKSRLPFVLTAAQEKAIQDALNDLASGKPMNRLLQGDVGSGKTVVAAILAALIAENNGQTAIMTPTSILAEQHYQTFIKLLGNCDDTEQTSDSASRFIEPQKIRLITGATAENEKLQIREGLLSGEIKIIIGTHALIEDPVQFQNLQLIVVDEQHRFGVEQRALLRSKGENPHLLVMTATPIPRSLALTIYGDLDLTLLDELPPGRQPINTHLVLPRERERVYRLIQNQVEKGKQAYIIYPLIEENENNLNLSAIEEAQRLQMEVFPNLKVGLLHGKLKADEK
ncbi:MAG: ATP-dependent DNA helicase RecG, partial [Anaerolineales bacterium]